MSTTTAIWICPTCGYVDDDSRDLRCARDHPPTYFAQILKGERLRDNDGAIVLRPVSADA